MKKEESQVRAYLKNVRRQTDSLLYVMDVQIKHIVGKRNITIITQKLKKTMNTY